jgi:phosphatidate cytidylyltransferase
MLIKRIVTALSTAALAIALFIYAPIWLTPILLVVLSGLVQFEFYQIVSKKYEVAPVAGLVAGTLWMTVTAAFPVCSFGQSAIVYAMCALVMTVVGLSTYILFNSKYKSPLAATATTLFGFFYIPFLISFFMRTIQLYTDKPFGFPDTRAGVYMLLFLVCMTKISDMGGFAIGKMFGKHKMCPSISPKKSWEGLAGGILGSCLVAFLFMWISSHFKWGEECSFWLTFTPMKAIVSGFVFAIAATVGDLVESRFKREFDVKDSGTFMPAGLGGFLDMFDSLLFIPALFYPILYWSMLP